MAPKISIMRLMRFDVCSITTGLSSSIDEQCLHLMAFELISSAQKGQALLEGDSMITVGKLVWSVQKCPWRDTPLRSNQHPIRTSPNDQLYGWQRAPSRACFRWGESQNRIRQPMEYWLQGVLCPSIDSLSSFCILKMMLHFRCTSVRFTDLFYRA